MLTETFGLLANEVLKRRSLIFSIMEGFGTIATFISTIKANGKANERRHAAQAMKGENLTRLELFKAELPAYLKPFAICVSTVALTGYNEHLNQVEKGEMLLGLATLAKLYSDHRKATTGAMEQLDREKIEQGIAEGKAELIPKREPDYHEGKDLYYDEYSEQWFYARPEWVLEAEQSLNKVYSYNEYANANVFYKALRQQGVEEVKPMPGFELLGWAKWHIPKNGLCSPRYLEFYHIPSSMADGTKYIIIEMADEPESGYFGY